MAQECLTYETDKGPPAGGVETWVEWRPDYVMRQDYDKQLAEQAIFRG